MGASKLLLLLTLLVLGAAGAPPAHAVQPAQIQAFVSSSAGDWYPGDELVVTASLYSEATTVVTATLTLPAGAIVTTWARTPWVAVDPDGNPTSSTSAGAPYARIAVAPQLPIARDRPMTIWFRVRVAQLPRGPATIALVVVDTAAQQATAETRVYGCCMLPILWVPIASR